MIERVAVNEEDGRAGSFDFNAEVDAVHREPPQGSTGER
jgi:hypothetical protein